MRLNVGIRLLSGLDPILCPDGSLAPGDTFIRAPTAVFETTFSNQKTLQRGIFLQMCRRITSISLSGVSKLDTQRRSNGQLAKTGQLFCPLFAKLATTKSTSSATTPTVPQNAQVDGNVHRYISDTLPASSCRSKSQLVPTKEEILVPVVTV